MYLDVAVIKSNLIFFVFVLFFFFNRREKTTKGKTKQERGGDGACLVSPEFLNYKIEFVFSAMWKLVSHTAVLCVNTQCSLLGRSGA